MNNAVLQAVKDTVRKRPVLSAAMVIMVVVSAVAAVLPPLVLERIINRLSGGKWDSSQMLLYVALLVLSGFLDAGRESLIAVFGQKVTHRIRSLMSQKMNRLPAAYFAERDEGDITSRFVNDVETIEDLFTSGLISMFADALRMISIIAVIFMKSMGLGIMLLIFLPFIFLFTRSVQKRTLTAQMENRKAVGEANHHIPDTLHSIRMIHNLNAEPFMEKRYDQSIERSFQALSRVNFFDAIYSPIILTVNAAVIALMVILASGSSRSMQFFGLSVGTAVALIAYVNQIFAPIESIGMEIQNIQAAGAGIRRIREFMNEEELPVIKEEAAVSTDQMVRFCHVSFGYREDQEILSDLSFSVQKGERVTLTGRTGAGKSTIFKLMLGLYRPWQGDVLIDGCRADAVAEENRRSEIGCVEQQFQPIPGTVFDQIAMYDDRISQKEAEHALETVGLLETVSGFPDGLNEVYRSSMFSNGQNQLLSIARAVVSDPKILLLDEMTADLDAATEQTVLNALDHASKGRTVISISHRLSSISGDRVIEIQ